MSLGGVILWLRADQGIAVATGVSSWADLSGNGNNVTQGTGANQPTLVAASAALGGMPALSFNGTSNRLINAAFATGANQPFTLMLVTANDAAAGTLFWVDFGGAGGESALLFNSTGWAGFSGSFITSTNTSTAAKAFAYVANGASSALYINSSTVPVKAANAGTNPLLSITIGCASGGLDFESGLLAEVVLFSRALNAPQRGQMFAYFSSRYGFSAS